MEGTAYLLSAKPWGEGGSVVVLFCPERGVVRGLIKHSGPKQAAMLQPFNSVTYRHGRRLASQLGSVQLELTKSRAHLLFAKPQQALALAAVADLLGALLPEEHPYPAVAVVLESLLSSDLDWRFYAGFERVLLEQIGYGLHLHSPVACAVGSALAYVSPNTWRSVPQAVAKGYEARLLMLPHCWGGLPMDEAQDCTAALTLTGALLGRALHGPFAMEKLAARGRLVQHYLQKLQPIAAAA